MLIIVATVLTLAIGLHETPPREVCISSPEVAIPVRVVQELNPKVPNGSLMYLWTKPRGLFYKFTEGFQEVDPEDYTVLPIQYPCPLTTKKT